MRRKARWQGGKGRISDDLRVESLSDPLLQRMTVLKTRIGCIKRMGIRQVEIVFCMHSLNSFPPLGFSSSLRERLSPHSFSSPQLSFLNSQLFLASSLRGFTLPQIHADTLPWTSYLSLFSTFESLFSQHRVPRALRSTIFIKFLQFFVLRNYFYGLFKSIEQLQQ